MGKQVSYTVVTALDANIPRQLALDLLHSHEEVISLNPLVTDVRKIETPQTAAADEYFAQWYEITEKITFLPGFKKTIKFKGCWYDQPWGVQTHSVMGSLFDLRCTYKIGGNQPGEPREIPELGVNKPADGLYLREDIQIDLHIPAPASFVKKEMQNASATMIARMKRKAELLDEGRLLALFEDGKLKTTKANTANMFDTPVSPAVGFGNGPQPSPRSDQFSAAPGRYSDLNYARSVHRHSARPGSLYENADSRSIQRYSAQPGFQYENADSIGAGPIAEMSAEPMPTSVAGYGNTNSTGAGHIAEMGARSRPTFVAELDASVSAAPRQRAGSQPVSDGVGSQSASTDGTPQFGRTATSHAPPANDPNVHHPVMRPAQPALNA